MSEQTPNYGLIKSTYNETADIVVMDDNMTIIDTKMKEIEDAAKANPGADSVSDAAIGDRTPDASQAPTTPGTGKLGQLISWLANRIKAITGKTNWWDTPDTTLAAANTHINAASPHSGHATTSGLNTHAATKTTTGALGHVQVGSSLLVDSNGIITHPTDKQCNYAYTHPTDKQCNYSYSYSHPSSKQCTGGDADTLDGSHASAFATAGHNHSGTYEPVDSNIMRKNASQTMSAQLTAQNNTSYTTAQVRNAILSTGDPSGGSNGDIWLKYIS